MIERLEYLKNNYSLPKEHLDYLIYMRDQLNVMPEVIYDIGACTLHWYMAARLVWPSSRIIAFEAMTSCRELYELHGVEYHCDLLGPPSYLVDFYENEHDPAGNSYYLENSQINPNAPRYYNDSNKTRRYTHSLDAIVALRQFPLPNLIKMDVQGAELDIMKYGKNCVDHANNIILETQSIPYNQGAPLEPEINQYLKDQGFKLVKKRFSGDHIQGDSHYTRQNK